jgi:ketosteroid isomerase-like protein
MGEDIVQEFYAKIGSGDFPGLFSLLASDIVWRLHGPTAIPYFGIYRGPQGVADFFQKLDAAERINEFMPTEFIPSADGKYVLVRGRESCTSRHTGRSFSTEWVHIFQIEGGKIHSFEEFIDSAAVEAAYRRP